MFAAIASLDAANAQTSYQHAIPAGNGLLTAPTTKGGQPGIFSPGNMAAQNANSVQITGGSGIFTGTLAAGNGSGPAAAFLNGAPSSARQIKIQSNGSQVWSFGTNTSAESGDNEGANFVINSYSDSGTFINSLLVANRAGPYFGKGGPNIVTLAPFSQQADNATSPGGTSGDYIQTYDTQPAYTLDNTPVSVTSGSTTATIAWTGCCASGNSPLRGGYGAYVKLVGIGTVGGVTIDGNYVVGGFPDANHFTITLPTAATSTAIGGNSGATAQPEFSTYGVRLGVTVTSPAPGYSLGFGEYYNANPNSGISAAADYESQFLLAASPVDPNFTGSWSMTGVEQDYLNRGKDEGYSPELYTAPERTVGQWLGPWPVDQFNNGGAGHPWNTIIGIFNGKEQGNGLDIGSYTGFDITEDALMGQDQDPNGHGGVGVVEYGSFIPELANYVHTTSGSSTVQLAMPTWFTQYADTTFSVYMPTSFTLFGVTLSAGYHAITAIAPGLISVAGSGPASASGVGGNAGWLAVKQFEPYAPMDFYGSWRHGISTEDFHSLDGSIINTQPGNGLLWNDGTGSASVTSTELSLGNITVDLNPAGSGLIEANGVTQLRDYTVGTLPTCNAGSSGELAYVTDATSPTYNATITGGGTIPALALCNGTNWTAH